MAGKTGTTSDYTDAWFIGYTPKLTTAVWMGYANARHPVDNIHGVTDVDGGSIPATLFHRFMAAAGQGSQLRRLLRRRSTRSTASPAGSLGLPSGVGYPVGTGSTTTTTTTVNKPTTTTVPTSTTTPRTTAPPTTAPATTVQRAGG